MKKENVECNKGCVNYYKVVQMGLWETKRKKTMKASPKATSNIIQASDMVSVKKITLFNLKQEGGTLLTQLKTKLPMPIFGT